MTQFNYLVIMKRFLPPVCDKSKYDVDNVKQKGTLKTSKFFEVLRYSFNNYA